ncbi:hypothetical protein TBK1r_47630 [Stieleria magnilauensis]|uniref:Secreted protein n=1 Tax=Stieleria magnilauensis TaxID=2527963 RepID=A0ABX5XUS8_9BACT|nr:hypothetical protein TBK1r_47630 [Planctomycetes bacterium TBK1r]
MPIRLLFACGMLAVACPVSAQVHYYDHGAPVYDSHVAPHYGSHHYDGHRGHAHAHAYSHGYRSLHAPLDNQYGAFQYDAVPSHQAFGYEGYGRGHGDSCPGASVCPLQSGYGYADSLQQYEQFGNQHDRDGQFGSSQNHDGHAHDQGHNHSHDGQGSSLAPRSDFGRLQPFPRNQVPFRDQVAPSMQTVPPSDRQPVAPPTLPPSSLSRPSRTPQFDTPLGDGPPPNTVPLSSPRRSVDRNPGPAALNI